MSRTTMKQVKMEQLPAWFRAGIDRIQSEATFKPLVLTVKAGNVKVWDAEQYAGLQLTDVASKQHLARKLINQIKDESLDAYMYGCNVTKCPPVGYVQRAFLDTSSLFLLAGESASNTCRSITDRRGKWINAMGKARPSHGVIDGLFAKAYPELFGGTSI